MMIWLLLVLGAIANVANAQANVDAAQLEGWRNFFDKTSGGSWTRCRNKKDNPCTCEGGSANVTCTDVDGTLFITSIRLRNNGLSGVNVPGGDLEAIVGGYSGFTVLDIGGNPNLKNTRGGCIRIPSCTTGTASCIVGYPICANSGTESPVAGGSIVPTTAVSRTSSPTPGVTVPSTTAWRRFFDATTGLGWTRCSSTRLAPCDCQRNQVATAPIRVLCTGAVITRISLINNNLTAATFPAKDLGDLIRAGAAYVDLTGNPGLAASEECFDVPECNNEGVICVLPKPLCSSSLSPGTSPNTPTFSPSSSGTTSPSSTQSSTSPTTSNATAAPSSVGSTAPTTSTPGTSSPTIFLPPSVAPPPTTATKVPTFQPGTTGTPTSSQTSAPSSSGTIAPTVAPGTKGPTSPVQTTTGSPTAASTTLDGCRVAAAVLVVGLVGLAL